MLSGLLRDKTTADILLYTPNDDTQNYPFYRLQLVVETFGHSTKPNQSKFNSIHKVFKPTKEKKEALYFGD